MGSIPKQHQDLSKQGGVRCDPSRQLVKNKRGGKKLKNKCVGGNADDFLWCSETSSSFELQKELSYNQVSK